MEYTNSNITDCCDKCNTNKFCYSWSIYPVTIQYSNNVIYTCRLFDSFRLNAQNKLGFQSGFNQKLSSFGFYSENDRFQLKFFNLIKNYTFLNALHLYEKEDQDLLAKMVEKIQKDVRLSFNNVIHI
jgi:hypothetical protein